MDSQRGAPGHQAHATTEQSQSQQVTFSQNYWLMRTMEDERITMIQSETHYNNHKTVCKPQPSPLQQLCEWDWGPARAALSCGSVA